MTVRFLSLALLVYALFLSGPLRAETGSPMRIDESRRIDLARAAIIYPDLQASLDPETIIEKLGRGDPGLSLLPDGFSGTIWFALPLTNNTEQTRWLLQIRQALLARIDLWLFSEGRILSHQSAGISYNRIEAQPGFALGYQFPVELPNGADRILIVRIEPVLFLASTPSLAPIMQAHLDTAMRRMIFPLLLGSYLGIAALHIILFLRSGGISNLFFVGSVVGVFSDWFIWLGGANDLWPGLSVAEILAISDVTWLAATFFILVFCIDFFSSDRRKPLPYILILVPYFLLMIALFSFNESEFHVSALLSFLLLTSTIIYVTGAFAIRRGVPGARLALIAYSVGIASELSAYVGLVMPWSEGFRDWFASTVGIFDVPTLLSQVLLNGLFSMALWEQIRARVREREAAAQAERARSVHLAQLCHDIRSPLHAVLSVVGAMSAPGSKLMADPRHVAAVRSSIRSIAGVLDDVVETARFGPAHRSRCGAVDLRRLVDDSAAVTRTAISGKDVVVQTSIPDDVPQVIESNEIALQRILGNLLSNSARETERGTIRISVRRSDREASWLRVEVSDTGPGLSADLARSLHEGDIVGEAGSGTVSPGFGLCVIRRLVEGLGGKVGATGSPRLGTTIWFDFPAPAASVRREAEAAADFPCIPGLRLLLVEDEPLTAVATKALLHANGHKVVDAANAQDAVGLAASQPFDLVLMDLDLAGRSGLTAIRSIRRLRDPVRAAVPIIVLTGDREVGEEAGRASLGVQSVLVKPFDFASLERSIASAVGLDFEPPIDVNRGTRPFLDDLAGALAPADLERLLATAMEQIAANREALEAAVRASRLRTAQRVAHRLAGSAAIVGMTELREAARRAEKAARDRDRWKLAATLDPISRAADAALSALRAFEPETEPDRLSAE